MGLFNRFKHSNEQKIKRPDAHTTQDEQIKKDVTRCFCYGSFTSNKKIIWKIIS